VEPGRNQQPHPLAAAVSKRSGSVLIVGNFNDFNNVVQRMVVGFVAILAVTTKTKRNCSHAFLNEIMAVIEVLPLDEKVPKAPLTLL
jgi:endonuclease/exonuclease/phosphatase (EEP) superfamily protein YafD